jgi:hypothetical protein
MNIRTTALAALLALAAPTAAQADFWSDFFGDADEVKRLYFGVHASGDLTRENTSAMTGERLGDPIKMATFDQDFECDLRVVESCTLKAKWSQLFKIVRRIDPNDDELLLYDIYYRTHSTIGDPKLIHTYRWEELQEPVPLPLDDHQANRAQGLTIRFYEAGQ